MDNTSVAAGLLELELASTQEIIVQPEAEASGNCGRLETLQRTTDQLKEAQQRYQISLKEMRLLVKELRATLAAKHAQRRQLLADHIVFLERELGTVDLREHFAENELRDMNRYLSVNPYLKSLLEKRNGKLLQNLLTYQRSATQSPTQVIVFDNRCGASLPVPDHVVLEVDSSDVETHTASSGPGKVDSLVACAETVEVLVNK